MCNGPLRAQTNKTYCTAKTSQPLLKMTNARVKTLKAPPPMARIIAISSQVAYGHVGLSIIVPALHALGHTVMALPTVLLSNHPGNAYRAGSAIDPEVLHEMLDALGQNGWLTSIDAIMTGYLPTVDHVAFARRAVEQVRATNPARHVTYLCDPVLGDDPKGLYIDERAAIAIRNDLIPHADIVTPNRFELSFLLGRDVNGAATTASPRPAIRTIATSIPSANPGETLNVSIFREARSVTRVPLRANAPHGTGDLFSALYLAAHLEGGPDSDALAFATAGVDRTLAASAGADALLISALPNTATAPAPWPVEPQTS